MELPFSPSFFKKIDIYQQLIDYEKESFVKHTWVVEKLVLEWAAGPKHQHIGEHISPDTIMQFLWECINKGRVPIESMTYASTREGVSQALKSLVVRGYAVALDQAAYPNHIRFTSEGLAAGEVISQTQFLKRTARYAIWTKIWWLLAISAMVIVMNEAFHPVRVAQWLYNAAANLVK